MNGIEDIVGRADLADRGIFVMLEPIGGSTAAPRASCGASLRARDPASWASSWTQQCAACSLPDIRLTSLPRMADFALWATACETALWPAGTFMHVYDANRRAAVEGLIETDPVAVFVRKLMDQRSSWSGTASDLLCMATYFAGDDVSKKSADWPRHPGALAGRLRRAQTFLRTVGIEICFLPRGPSRNTDNQDKLGDREAGSERQRRQHRQCCGN